ncbi:diguanylate cyclase [Roseomonas aeriglobus]|nr:diguanylate cyclase [Roseomonas aeriglobus]
MSLVALAALIRGSLSAKLTLFYSALFAVAVALILIGAQAGIRRSAERMIRNEMAASAKVFDRVTAMRYAQLGDASTVLAADFGFRSAVATDDAPTIASALESLRNRLRLDQAFFVDVDGAIVGYRGRISTRDARDLLIALENDRTRGVLRIGSARFNAAASAVKVPVTVGWVVFGNALDAREMARLGRLSSIDLAPRIVPAGTLSAVQRSGAATEQDVAGKRVLIQASPIASFRSDEPQMLLLQHSVTKTLADYRPMLWLLLGCGIVGIGLAGAGSFLLARRISRPIIALKAAAIRAAKGDYTQVAVTTQDELGALAVSFNRMVDDIDARERQITHMALHDGLTGLANRVLLREYLTTAFARVGSGRRQALFCLDLDQFKVVNDTLGHPTGDALLCDVARRLSDFAGDGFVARLGGTSSRWSCLRIIGPSIGSRTS